MGMNNQVITRRDKNKHRVDINVQNFVRSWGSSTPGGLACMNTHSLDCLFLIQVEETN